MKRMTTLGYILAACDFAFNDLAPVRRQAQLDTSDQRQWSLEQYSILYIYSTMFVQQIY